MAKKTEKKVEVLKPRKAGRSYPDATVKGFYRALDVKLPNVVKSVVETMEQADNACSDIMMKMVQEAQIDGIAQEKILKALARELINWKKLKLESAKILISKAPERIANAEGGDLFTKLIERIEAKKDN